MTIDEAREYFNAKAAPQPAFRKAKGLFTTHAQGGFETFKLMAEIELKHTSAIVIIHHMLIIRGDSVIPNEVEKFQFQEVPYSIERLYISKWW